MIAVVPVRDGVPAPGAGEAVADASGRVLLIGSGTTDALRELPADTQEIALAEVGPYRPGAWAAALAAELSAERIIVLPASADGRDLAPALAVRMRRGLVTGALQVADDHCVVGLADHRAQAELGVSAPVIATLEPGSRAFLPGPPLNPTIREVWLSLPDTRDAETVEIIAADPASIGLEEAHRIVAGGIGLGDVGAFEQLGRVAELLGASVGATRPAVDAGWTEFGRQIGTTGAMVDPDLYIAVAISGAVQHTSGLGSPGHVVAINVDPSCPMMRLADLAIVADGPAVLEALERRLQTEATDGS